MFNLKNDLPLMINGVACGYMISKMNFTFESFVLYAVLGITIIWYGNNMKKNK